MPYICWSDSSVQHTMYNNEGSSLPKHVLINLKIINSIIKIAHEIFLSDISWKMILPYTVCNKMAPPSIKVLWARPSRHVFICISYRNLWYRQHVINVFITRIKWFNACIKWFTARNKWFIVCNKWLLHAINDLLRANIWLAK